LLIAEAENMLKQKLIPFWQSLRDDRYGGFTGWMGFDLKKDEQADKGCIFHSRILWFFSTAAMALHRADLLEDAKHAYLFLKQHCLDPENGGIYWSVRCDGTVQDSTKDTYNQAFAIYAFSAYYLASGDRGALETAFELYRTVEKRCADETGYLEAFDREFHPISNEKLSDNAALLASGRVAEKTMNTLLYVFEGYSGLFEAMHDAAVGFLNAFEKEPDHREYLRAVSDIWRYINDKLVDPRTGSEWFWQVDDDLAEPGGYLLAPLGEERVGDVSNVVFTNGAIVRGNGEIYLYYASSDTRLYVASTTLERLKDYVFHTPPDANRSADCVRQRCKLIDKNLAILKAEGER
jgi:hypothetical protein